MLFQIVLIANPFCSRRSQYLLRLLVSSCHTLRLAWTLTGIIGQTGQTGQNRPFRDIAREMTESATDVLLLIEYPLSDWSSLPPPYERWLSREDRTEADEGDRPAPGAIRREGIGLV